ncbi:MFS general substrate transporter [Apiospora phragmitis]|uniref:MFS general substrate transporter n=1 Tax=Apiospora phragmitis TaxID=2905665 RepID=A0ABR1WS77_9PEZI
MWLRCLIYTVSPIGAAFTTSATALVVCLGALYGIGAGLLFAPSIDFLGDWFVERKSFTYGVICGAGAAAGAGLSPVYAPLFMVFLAATIVQALAHYGPSVYLPSMGADLGLSSEQGALLVALLNLAQAIGQPLQGILTHSKASFYTSLVLSTLGGGVEILLIWPFARNLLSLSL